MKKKRYESINSESVQDRPMNINELSDKVLNPDLKDSYLKLEQKSNALSETINKLLEQLSAKEDEIVQLKKIISQSSQQSGTIVNIALSDEEVIADIQLNKLKDAARTRELTLDEIRKFDLLVKNKRLAQGNATTIDGKVNSMKQLGTSELIKIASTKIEE
jgi:hypothetical protein